SGLVDKSLVLLETEALEARYRMLETMRQFARERLDAAGEAGELGRRHAQFFLARAESAERFLSNQSEGWQERLAEDLGNLRAAADWFEQDPAGGEDSLRLTTALHWFWFGLGHYREARRRLEAALARTGSGRYWITYALYWQGVVAQARGDFAAARAAFDEGVTLGLEDGFNQPIAHLATMRGRLALAEGDSEGALRWFAVALTPLKRMQNHWSTIILAEDLGRIAAERGEHERAARLL